MIKKKLYENVCLMCQGKKNKTTHADGFRFILQVSISDVKKDAKTSLNDKSE